MNLYDYLGKKVEVIDIDNVKFTGDVAFYTSKIDNPENKESITIDVGKDLICFNSDEIKSIEILIE